MKKGLVKWILVYVFWVITAALGFLCLISTTNLSISILYLFNVNRWTASVADKMIFIIVGILSLVLVVVAECYYREAVAKKILWKRFSLITAIQLLCLSVAHLIPVLIISGWNISWGSLLLPGIELIGGVIFFAQYKFRRRISKMLKNANFNKIQHEVQNPVLEIFHNGK